jgi:hypothetical protein
MNSNPKKYVNFEKKSDFELVQIRNCLEHEKPEKKPPNQ